MISIEEQEIIIRAICEAERTYQDFVVLSEKAILDAGYIWGEEHRLFIDDYLTESGMI